MKLINIYFDGGSKGNPGLGYGSYEVQSLDAQVNHKCSRSEFGTGCTSNQAEYFSLLAALKWLRHRDIAFKDFRLEIWTDSLLVCNQVRRKWKTKVCTMKELRDEVLELLAAYGHWQINWRGRAANVARNAH